MFEDITQDSATYAIKALIKERETKINRYAVWWHGKLVSPSRVITKHYELNNSSIERGSFNTNPAQDRLLTLGFPIIDTLEEDSFFTNKELVSFEKLIRRKDYNPSNEVDVNIGKFLRDTVWSKTVLWAKKLEQKGWTIVGKRRGWNTRHQKKGFQTYKQYAWCSLKPQHGQNNLLLFTVGVGTNGDLEYKMDIQWNNKSFTQDQRDLFSKLREEAAASFQYIKKENISNYDWNKLITVSDRFFTKHLDTYNNIYYSLWPERRLMRLVYNENNWQVPIERYWNKKWQGRTDKAHHEQYGFGFEEWLFNTRYLINGYQYGYIRGIDTMPQDTNFINELYLYTLDHKTNQEFLIAKLIDVNILNEDDIDHHVLNIFESTRKYMHAELEKVKADTKLIKKIPLKPNISFDLNKAIFYEDSVLLPKDLIKIHRFIPNKVNGELAGIVDQIDKSFKIPKLNFNEGNGTGTNKYNQTIQGGQRDVNRTHADITNDLHKYLEASSDYSGYKISTEKTKVGNNLVDCAVKKKNSLELFEVKTTKSFLTNIRLALGQILEYALLDKDIIIDKLIIVGPVNPNDRDLEYFSTLKKLLDIPLVYWSYSFEEKKLEKKFIEY